MNKQILEYFDGSMSLSDREIFELKLKDSPDIAAELRRLQNLSEMVKRNSDIPLPADYAVTIIPRMRERQRKEISQPLPYVQAAFSGAFSFVVIGLLVWYFAFLPIKHNHQANESGEVLAYLQEVNPVQNADFSLPDDISEAAAEKINTAYAKALHLSSEDVSGLIDVAYDNAINDGTLLLSEISDEDAEYLVAELNKTNKLNN